MHSAEIRDARVSSKTMAAARKAALEKLSSQDFLVRCAKLQELNHWEYTQYTQALSLLKHVNITFKKICRYEIKMVAAHTFEKDIVYKQLHKNELKAHGVYHMLCNQLSWYRHVLETAERVLRYRRLSLLNCSTEKRMETLKKLQVHISKFGGDKGNISFDRVISPLEQLKKNIETDCASLSESSSAYKTLSKQLQSIANAMEPTDVWLKTIRSSSTWKAFIYQVISTSTQMIKMLKWSSNSIASAPTLDAIVRGSSSDLLRAGISRKRIMSEEELLDPTLKGLDGDYKLEACTPFHLNYQYVPNVETCICASRLGCKCRLCLLDSCM